MISYTNNRQQVQVVMHFGMTVEIISDIFVVASKQFFCQKEFQTVAEVF
jgi:hypothetical protein